LTLTGPSAMPNMTLPFFVRDKLREATGGIQEIEE
jgi:hypothetical protein